MSDGHFARNFANFAHYTKISRFNSIRGWEVEIKFQEFPGVRSKFQEFSSTPGILRACRNHGLSNQKSTPQQLVILGWVRSGPTCIRFSCWLGVYR